MFDFIKKKLKDSIDSIQKKLVKEEKEEERLEEQMSVPQKEIPQPQPAKEESIPEETKLPEKGEEPKQVKESEKKADETPAGEKHEKEKPIIENKIKEPKRKALKESVVQEKKQEAPKSVEKSVKSPKTEEKPQKRKRIFSHKITSDDIASIYSGLKEALLENSVAMEVVMAIHKDLENSLMGKEVSFLSNKKEIEAAIKKSISDVMIEYSLDKFLADVTSKKPYIILFMGVNGAGKTTTIAKLINFLQKKDMKIVVSASDTFRAASIEQIEIHTKKLGVNLIKHSYGADPAAVAFDAIKHAHSENADVVLIDTAGRSDINKNLIEELKKVKRVSKPDLTIFVGDALTGNDAVNQARIFDREVGIDSVILSKADVDKKGGAILSISYVTKKPILFLGTGQGYDDLVPFNKERTAAFILD